MSPDPRFFRGAGNAHTKNAWVRANSHYTGLVRLDRYSVHNFTNNHVEEASSAMPSFLHRLLISEQKVQSTMTLTRETIPFHGKG